MGPRTFLIEGALSRDTVFQPLTSKLSESPYQNLTLFTCLEKKILSEVSLTSLPWSLLDIRVKYRLYDDTRKVRNIVSRLSVDFLYLSSCQFGNGVLVDRSFTEFESLSLGPKGWNLFRE